MSYEDQIRLYGERCNLMAADMEVMIGLLNSAVNDERAACASVAAGMQGPTARSHTEAAYNHACREVVAAIRARGK